MAVRCDPGQAGRADAQGERVPAVLTHHAISPGRRSWRGDALRREATSDGTHRENRIEPVSCVMGGKGG
jgi:hypothetical protein